MVNLRDAFILIRCVPDTIAVAKAIEDQIQLMARHRAQYASRNGVHPCLFLGSFPYGHIKIALALLESKDMDEFVCCDVKHEWNQLDEGAAPLDGIQDPVVLQADPVEVKTLRWFPATLLLRRIPAELRKNALMDLMILELREGLHVIPIVKPLAGHDAEMPTGQAFCVCKGLCDTEPFRSIEAIWNVHFRTEGRSSLPNLLI
jgi:hypothetical protein